MEASNHIYTVHPVNFDADIICEACRQQHADHYIVSKYIMPSVNNYLAEVCEVCAADIAAELSTFVQTWSLLES